MVNKLCLGIAIFSSAWILSFSLPASTEAATNAELEARIAALEAKLAYLTVNTNTISGLAGPHVIFSGANVHIQNGAGENGAKTNGVGNFIVGYNANPANPQRGGSHNLVVGARHHYSSYGGFVAGMDNTVSGEGSSVSGGRYSIASGVLSSISGGQSNSATQEASSISGGTGNVASGRFSFVSGGENNTASGYQSSINGGRKNTASGRWSSITGGGGMWSSQGNTASADYSTVVGGAGNKSNGLYTSVIGGEENIASGTLSSVIGGQRNVANGDYSNITGGSDQTTTGAYEVIPASPLAPFLTIDSNTYNGTAGPNIIFSGANIHVRSGGGVSGTDENGLGNFVVGAGQ